MAHPDGGRGSYFSPDHSFEEVFALVGTDGVVFSSTTGEEITAWQGLARDGKTQTIVFRGKNSRHGNVCPACWGYRCNCSGTRIGQCVEALDEQM